MTLVETVYPSVREVSQSVAFNGIKLRNGAMDAYSLGLTRDVLSGTLDLRAVADAVGKVGSGLTAGIYAIRFTGNGSGGTVQLVDASPGW